ncbi:hypothetical protein SLS58_002865 [Diplodia intermedia]|uniref:Uncharacterized protein n=1 Tax=Diplodia intermedia TaxID=856260 RepID=A0ABR3TXV0_9PEZI
MKRVSPQIDQFFLSYIPAAVEWQSPDAGEPHFHPRPIDLAVDFSAVLKRASFCMDLRIIPKERLRWTPNTRLSLDADRISSVEAITDIPGQVASIVAWDVVGVRLKVEDPGSRIGSPPDFELTPRDETSADALRMLHDIAHAHVVTFYVPSEIFTGTYIASLRTVAQQKNWRQSFRVSMKDNIIDGAMFLLHTTLDANIPGSAEESSALVGCPSHDRLSSDLPDEPFPKRRRLENSIGTDRFNAMRDRMRQTMEERNAEKDAQRKQQAADRSVQDQSREDYYAEWRKDIGEKIAQRKQEKAEWRKQVNEGIQEKLRQIEEDNQRRMEMTEARIITKLDEHMEKFEQDFNAHEAMAAARVEIHDWATGKMRNVADQILKEINGAKSTMGV